MWLDKETEKLFMIFLNPLETPLPTELHELSRALLDGYRKQAQKSKEDISFHHFMYEILDKYYPYIEKLVVEKKVAVTEHTNILKWWKEIIAVPSIQGLLIYTPYSMATPVLKLCLVTGYLVKSKWHKRSLRKLITSLGREIQEGRSLKEFSETMREYEEDMLVESVASAENEVDELATILIEARKRIYWHVKSEQDERPHYHNL